MIFIGIDPGKKGGISIINTDRYIRHVLKDGETTIEKIILPLCIEMPLTINNEIDVNELFKMMPIPEMGTIFCVIEKAQSMSGQGVKSMFTYGMGYGKILAVLELAGIPYQEVHPMKWKKEFQLIKKSKYDSASVAKKLFPDQNFVTDRGRLMDGKAESLLLAEYAKRIYK